MLLRANTLAKGNSGARVELVELLIECLNRGVLPVVPSRGSVGASGDLAPLAHLALPLVGEGDAWVEGRAAARRRSAVRRRSRADRAAREGRVVARQRHAVHGGCRRARPRSGAEAPGRCRPRLRDVRRGAQRHPHELPARRSTRCDRSAASRLRRRTSSSCWQAPRSSRRTAGATRFRTRTRSAARRRCTARSRDLLDYVDYVVSIELNAATDNPLVLVDDDMLVSNGNFHGEPVAFALDALAMAVAELASISERRTERIVNPHTLRRAARLPHGRGRPQLRLHDPPVRLGGARLGEQGACPSGERRLDPHERRSGGSCVDGECGGAEGLAGARERGERARDRAARGRAGGGVPRAARARCRRRRYAAVRALALGTARGRPLAVRATSRRWRGRFATARSRPRSRTRSESSHDRAPARSTHSSTRSAAT